MHFHIGVNVPIHCGIPSAGCLRWPVGHPCLHGTLSWEWRSAPGHPRGFEWCDAQSMPWRFLWRRWHPLKHDSDVAYWYMIYFIGKKLEKTLLNRCHSVIHNASQLLFAFWNFQRCGAASYRWCLFPWPCWWGPWSHDLAPPRGPRALLSLSSQSSAPQWYSLDSPGKSHPRSPSTSQGTPHQFDPLVPGRPKRGRPSRAGLRCRLRPVLPEAIHGNDAQWCAYMRICYCRIMLKQVPIKMLKLLCNRC